MDQDELAYLSLHDLADHLRSRALSPVEVTQTLLERTERLEPHLNAYITLTAEAAMADARRAEAEIGRGEYRGPLHGVPIDIKDIFWVKGVRTTMGSRAFIDFVPTEDAAAVSRLRDAGVVLLGKTNAPELCWVWFEGHAFGIPRNPWDVTRTPGISSAGSAAALAAGMSYGSLASDAGGSIRQPAAFSGVVGLKPTLGRISMYGAFPFTRDSTHAGPMARTVLDCAHLLDVMSGYDPRDQTSLDASSPIEGWAEGLAAPIQPLRIGVPREDFWGDLLQPDVAAAAEAALDTWRGLGWPVEEVTLGPVGPVAAAGSIVQGAEIVAEYRELFTERSHLLTRAVREMAAPALARSAVDYLEARAAWQAFGDRLEAALRRVDVLVTPARAFTAPRQSEDGKILDSLPKEGFRAIFNLAGVPAMSVPCGFDRDGLPVGVQIIGPREREDLVLAAGHAYQQVTDWHRRHPPAALRPIPAAESPPQRTPHP
jgi:aspartyl-tRNA(Asn)/glutamyl-tRNA(Gln) amidotransferase subunit A